MGVRRAVPKNVLRSKETSNFNLRKPGKFTITVLMGMFVRMATSRTTNPAESVPSDKKIHFQKKIAETELFREKVVNFPALKRKCRSFYSHHRHLQDPEIYL